VHDLLLLDLGLPGREGLAVLKGLRERGSTLPVVILTAFDIGELVRRTVAEFVPLAEAGGRGLRVLLRLPAIAAS
jgi:DNA-binding NarL/FixJ family response regulator